MIKLLNLIKENSSSTYDYGCVMIYFKFPEIKIIHNKIDIKDIYIEEGDQTYGLEDEPHTTLLFGLHEEVTDEDVKNIINKYTFGECIINTPSLFNNEKYDVLKFDVDGKNLHSINKDLKQFPFTSTYSDYHPHLTIGYLKVGKGQKYIDILNESKLNKFSLIPQYVVYSKPDGSKSKLKIKLK